MATEKITQNIANTIKEVGENLVLFYLYSKVARNTDWGVYKNFNDTGTDIVLLKERNNKTNSQIDKIKIEVKTRQRIETTGKSNNSAQFTLTENEWKESDFVIGFWLEFNFIFIIPTEKLTKTTSKGKNIYKFTAVLTRATGRLTENSSQYLNRWDLIKQKQNGQSNNN